MHELLQKLKAGASAIRKVRLPRAGTDGNDGPELGLRILTEADYLDAGLGGIETMRVSGHEEAGLANSDLFEACRLSELLLRALVDPATGKQLANNSGELRGVLTRADKNYLIEQYLDHEREFSPSEANMSAEDFAKLLDEVKKSPATPRLSGFSTAMLKRLVRSLAAPEQI